MRSSAFALIVIVLTIAGVIALGSALLGGGGPSPVTASALRRAPVGAVPVTVIPTPLDDYLTNPGIGWQNDGDDPLLPETTLYATRSDISWHVLNPAPGVFDWTPLDGWIETASAQGKQISFRVYTMRGEDFGGHEIPDWVLDRGAVILDSGEPDYSNCVYQAEWARMVDALRRRYDGQPEIAFIDISGYGNFNEWSWHNQTQWDDDALEPTTLDGQARRRLADMFLGGANDAHECRTGEGEVMTVAYDYAGFEHTQLVMPFAGVRQSTEYVVSRDLGVGIRYDCLGLLESTDFVVERIGDELEAVWPIAPVIFEMCGVSTENQYMEEAARLLQAAHGSLVHDNTVEPRSPRAIEDLLRHAGYRFVISKVIYPSAVMPGGTLPLLMDWQNVGYAPVYPRMGQDFVLHVGLMDSAGRLALDMVIEADIAGWMPASTLPGDPPVNGVRATLTVPDYVPDGRFTLVAALIDQRTNLPIKLGIEGRRPNGYYALGAIRVTGSVEALTPVAPEVFEPTATPVPTATPRPTATPSPTESPDSAESASSPDSAEPTPGRRRRG